MVLKISSAFKDGERIPQRHACFGLGISPPLQIEGTDPKAKSIALVMDDPDMPGGDTIFTHWVMWNIDPNTRKIEEGVPRKEHVLHNAIQGKNSIKIHGYLAPATPLPFRHTYRLKLYTLDTTIDLTSESTKEDLEKSMEGHVIQEALLRGVYW